jgi:Asp-tRNA(Asn)/Glu-tRNA(Gln) amidotransferase A subunit family amidase
LISEIDRGRSTRESEYAAALTGAVTLRESSGSVFADCDVILTFATPGEAPEALSTTGDATFNLSWSLLGWPCLCLPVYLRAAGLPLAVQLVAPYGHDRHLLQAAAWIERRIAISQITYGAIDASH